MVDAIHIGAEEIEVKLLDRTRQNAQMELAGHRNFVALITPAHKALNQVIRADFELSQNYTQEEIDILIKARNLLASAQSVDLKKTEIERKYGVKFE